MSGLAEEKGKEGLQVLQRNPPLSWRKGKLLALPTPTEAKAVMGNGEKRPQQELVKLVTRLLSLWFSMVGVHLLVWVGI